MIYAQYNWAYPNYTQYIHVLGASVKKKKMRRIIVIVGLFVLSGLSIFLYWFGNHGRLMFRPHMTEDWIIWGIALISFFCGIYLIRKHKSQ